MFSLFQRKKKKDDVEKVQTLRHIAFIMDGNGRWAQKRGLPRESGHKKGAEVFERIVRHCFDRGISTVTVYAFSTENWARPEREVSAIMTLLAEYLDRAEKKFREYDARLVFLGDKDKLSDALREKAICLENMTADRKNTLNIALNYGGRDEILHACRLLCADGVKDVTKEALEARLYTAGSPDPDLIVRTGGDTRISNFLLWQAAYAEFYFTKTLWPDLDAAEVDEAVADFCHRHRRYGGL